MIKTKNLALLAVAVVVLLGVSVMQKARHRSATTRPATESLVAGELKADDLSRIVLGRGGEDTVVLAAGPGGWVVESGWNARADQSRIDSLLRGLSGLRGEFRSRGGGVLADYGLDDGAAVSLRGESRDGGEAFALLAGEKPERFPGNFVRRPGADDVYLSEKSVLSLLGVYGEPAAPAGTFFYDLQAVREDRLDIDRLVIEHGGERLELVKEFAVITPAEGDSAAAPETDRSTWEWRLEGRDGVTLAKTKVDAALNGLVSIRAVDLDDPAAEAAAYGLDSPSATVRLVRADASELVLEFGADRAAEGDRQAGTWLRVAGRPDVWVVTDYTAQNARKTLDDLKAE
jgi:hypothetical protein